MNAGVIGGIVAATLIVVGIALLVWLRRRNRSSITEALKAIAIEHVTEVLVPDGMGGEIHVEHLLLTSRGILIIDVKRYAGIVFASDRMDQWTAIEQTGRQTFPNPLGSLYDRVAAVSQIVRGIDVAGFVVFPSQADFSKGRPQDVLLPDDLLARFARPEADEIGRLTEAYAPQWEKLRQAVLPA
jgi:hypothetical protein